MSLKRKSRIKRKDFGPIKLKRKRQEGCVGEFRKLLFLNFCSKKNILLYISVS